MLVDDDGLAREREEEREKAILFAGDRVLSEKEGGREGVNGRMREWWLLGEGGRKGHNTSARGGWYSMLKLLQGVFSLEDGRQQNQLF